MRHSKGENDGNDDVDDDDYDNVNKELAIHTSYTYPTFNRVGLPNKRSDYGARIGHRTN